MVFGLRPWPFSSSLLYIIHKYTYPRRGISPWTPGRLSSCLGVQRRAKGIPSTLGPKSVGADLLQQERGDETVRHSSAWRKYSWGPSCFWGRLGAFPGTADTHHLWAYQARKSGRLEYRHMQLVVTGSHGLLTLCACAADPSQTRRVAKARSPFPTAQLASLWRLSCPNLVTSVMQLMCARKNTGCFTRMQASIARARVATLIDLLAQNVAWRGKLTNSSAASNNDLHIPAVRSTTWRRLLLTRLGSSSAGPGRQSRSWNACHSARLGESEPGVLPPREHEPITRRATPGSPLTSEYVDDCADMGGPKDKRSRPTVACDQCCWPPTPGGGCQAPHTGPTFPPRHIPPQTALNSRRNFTTGYPTCDERGKLFGFLTLTRTHAPCQRTV